MPSRKYHSEKEPVMNARSKGNIENVRLLNRQQAAEYTGMGLNACRTWCNQIGATLVFSTRIIRFDKNVIDAELDRLAGR